MICCIAELKLCRARNKKVKTQDTINSQWHINIVGRSGRFFRVKLQEPFSKCKAAGMFLSNQPVLQIVL